MVVKHPRGEHAHGVAAVRGGFRLSFVHELPVFFFPNNVAWALLSFPVLFCFCPILPVFVAYPVWWVQEYTEEFREIAPRSKKNLGGVADGNITLINQRSVCDDLPVCNTYPHPPLIEASQTIIICAIIFYLPYFTDNLQNDFVFLSSFTNLCKVLLWLLFPWPDVCLGVQREAVKDSSERRFEACHVSSQFRICFAAGKVRILMICGEEMETTQEIGMLLDNIPKTEPRHTFL